MKTIAHRSVRFPGRI